MKPKFIFLIMLLCAACAPNISEPVNTAITASPTLQKTETPTPTLEPEATRDPLADAPDGATGIDDEGNFIKNFVTENNNTLTYTWDTERNAWYRSIFTGYMWDLSPENNNNKEYPFPDQLLLNIYIDQSIHGEMFLPTLSHKENTDPANTPNNFAALFLTDMATALINRGIIEKMGDFNFLKWNNGEFYLDFINQDGPQRLCLAPGCSMNVHIRGDYDVLKANMATNGFSETKKNTIYGPANSYMIKIWTDKYGNGYVDIAPSLPAGQWTEEIFNQMAFIGFGDIFEFIDLTHPKSGRTTAKFALNQSSLPYFTFGPPQ